MISYELLTIVSFAGCVPRNNIVTGRYMFIYIEHGYRKRNALMTLLQPKFATFTHHANYINVDLTGGCFVGRFYLHIADPE